MNILEKIDGALLDICKQFSSQAQRLIGINNFTIARFFLWTGYFVVCPSIILRKEIDELPNVILGLVVTTLIAFYVSIRIIRKYQNLYRQGHANRARLDTSWLRLFFFGAMIGFVIFAFPRFFLELFGNLPDEEYDKITSDSILIVTVVNIILLPVYFSSVEPDPPSKSKARKLLDKLRSFGRTPLPSPA